MSFARIAVDVIEPAGADLDVDSLKPERLQKIDQARVVALIARTHDVNAKLENSPSSNVDMKSSPALELNAYDKLIDALPELVVPLLEKLLHNRHEDVIDV